MIITLTTDFGPGSHYVGAMKGVMLSINPQVQIVDLAHSIPPQQVQMAAMVLADTARLFPAGTIHVVVVDPGVGTQRALVYAEIGSGHYVCPDNGVLNRLAEVSAPTKIVRITAERFFRHPVSSTFHGRDIMAPVAAHLSLGLDPDQLGPAHPALESLSWPGAEKLANRIEGQVVAIDSFGNLVTNISREMLAGVPTDESVAVRCDGHETRCIFSTYAEQPEMTLVALIGSNDQLELAIVGDSAAAMLGVGVATSVEVSW